MYAATVEEADKEDEVGVAEIEAFKVKDLWLELEVMSPVSIVGTYAISVVLYDGGEPKQTAGTSAGVQVQSQFKVRDFPLISVLHNHNHWFPTSSIGRSVNVNATITESFWRWCSASAHASLCVLLWASLLRMP